MSENSFREINGGIRLINVLRVNIDSIGQIAPRALRKYVRIVGRCMFKS